MKDFTINNFWKNKLAGTSAPQAKLVQGWSFISQGLERFKEAPLLLSDEYGSVVDPKDSQVLLVSAPGAVGKSTLSRQIAFETGAVYIDLAEAAPVGANTVSGGILKSGLHQSSLENVAILIDGLDEARMRVTQASFDAFIDDVVEVSKTRPSPIVLFGRTGATQEAWLLLEDKGISAPVLEIGYYGEEGAVDFALAALRSILLQRGKLSPLDYKAREDADKIAVSALLKGLREQTKNDGDRFSGYAPVLLAVAERVAQETNPAKLVADINKGDEPITLQTITTAILEREHSKLESLEFEVPSVRDTLYSHEEQMDRLVSRIYGQPFPPLPAFTSQRDQELYQNTLETWVAEHPFLQGGKAASAVFDAAINAYALRFSTEVVKSTVLKGELKKGTSSNPFLTEFYLPQNGEKAPLSIQAEHVGVVYASLRARLSLGDSATLSVDVDESDESGLRSDIEILLSRKGENNPVVLSFKTEQSGNLLLGAHIEDVNINAPQSTVEIGSGNEVVFVGPVTMQCGALTINADKVYLEKGAGLSAVHLEAGVADVSQVSSVSVRDKDIAFSVSWAGAEVYPWTSYGTVPTKVDNPHVDEGLRRLSKFIVAFRSHSKGSLQRFKDKIDHSRMTKGNGQAILDALITRKVITTEGLFYVLNQDRLSIEVGTNYHECSKRVFREQTVQFVEAVVAN